MGYDYEKMIDEMSLSAEKKSYAEAFTIGQSVMGRDIICAKTGSGKRKIFLSAAYHGLEYLTSAFLVRFLNEYIDKVIKNEPFFGFDVNNLYNSVTVFAAPMINPDGVDIAVHGIDLNNTFHKELIREAGIHDFQKVWQANAHGVDINHNFNAMWQSVTDKPSPTKYGGEFAECEPETRAVTEFIRKELPDMLIAFHSQGGEIYYDFNGIEGEYSREIAEKMAKISGYKACIPEGTASFGGCKDWFINEFNKEGFTVEIGHGKNPLPLSMLDDIYEENAKIILCAMNELKEKIAAPC